mgnify:CR=1 FL=1
MIVCFRSDFAVYYVKQAFQLQHDHSCFYKAGLAVRRRPIW